MRLLAIMERSAVDRPRLVVSNGLVAKRTQPERAVPAARNSPKSKDGRANVWLSPRTKERIQKAMQQIEDRIGFRPRSITEAAEHLIDTGLKALQAQQGEDVPPVFPGSDKF